MRRRPFTAGAVVLRQSIDGNNNENGMKMPVNKTLIDRVGACISVSQSESPETCCVRIPPRLPIATVLCCGSNKLHTD